MLAATVQAELGLPADLLWRRVRDEMPAAIFARWAPGMRSAWRTTSVGGLVWTARGLAFVPRTGEPALWGELWAPGGKLQTGEEAAAGFAREVQEETGLVITSCRPREGIVHQVTSGPRSLTYHFVIFTGIAEGVPDPGVTLASDLPETLAFRADYLPYAEGP